MAQALTHQMIAREAAAMLVQDNPVVKNINTDRQKEYGEEVNGYKKGDTVRIKVPPVPVVFDGAVFANGGSAPLTQETEVSLTLDTQKHVALTFGAKEKLLELSEFKERFLKPAMNSLSAIVNADLLTRMKNQTPNVVGTWGATPSTRAVYRSAASSLDRFLAPNDNRSLHFSSDANDGLAEANATLFHSKSEIEAEFDKNAVGMFAEFEFYKQQSIPVHTNGAGTGYLVNGASQVGGVLAVDTGTGAIPKGSTIVIAGVNAVNPLTGESTGKPRSFVVTADYAGGAGNVSIAPAIVQNTATQRGNVTALAADNAAITIFGTASSAARQNIGFHRDAFAAAFAPLPVLASCEGYTASIKGISVRVMTFGDGYNDKENTRIDVLYGEKEVRPDHSVRITE
ncbi:P22 phage major capsid protein family protein [Lysobacter capsici]|uniref:P22 phage major capsid protein family protein n=1 Tax=Lysobacter capsici TaxID=435897 RepID=UPI00287B73F3|nr:P22 phage major capsid protein family protein [Lysobacter capsici]WND79389.1 P22 phage major capsid protein family protein [Lysobacter capsici]WND84585.1 P22 phage major capsid protein family protein [Lysobacter capsici]